MSSRALARAGSALLLAALCIGRAPAQEKPKLEESRQALVFVEPWSGDSDIMASEAHLVATELFKTEMAATRKFVFASSAATESVEMVLRGTLERTATGYHLVLHATRADGGTEEIAVPPAPSLEDLVKAAALEVGKLKRRAGYVLKREGNRIIIARGSAEGVKVGQRYRTTDTFETFIIRKVSTQTAEGEIVTGPAAIGGAGGKLGSVDVVFLIDTTASMQEEIDGVLANAARFADRLGKSGIDARLGLVDFRVGVRATHPPTANIAESKSWVAPLRAGGGGDETPFQALEQAMALPFRPEARRIFVLITDEPAYDAIADAPLASRGAACGTVRPQSFHVTAYSGGIAERVLSRLRADKAVVFPVALNDNEGIYPHLAHATGGVYYDLHRSQDFSALLDTLGQRIEGMFVEM